ncbi:MAG: efflux RND transporter periplasmic adaptor subunit [Proteobacteria bacterium]|nr:efflux RND transporter periplasmic adaptor subunit [Pseudomonadota bacterium]
MDRQLTPRRRWLKRLVVMGLLLSAGIASAAMFAPESGRVLRIERERLTVAEVARGHYEDYIPIRGRVMPRRTIYLDAMAGGRVERVLVEDGALVETGQLLFQLSNTALQLDVISREAQISEQLNNLRNTELSLERSRLEHRRNLLEIDYELGRLARLIERQRALLRHRAVARAEFEDNQEQYAYFRRRRAIIVDSQRADERIQKVQMVQLRDSSAMLERNLAFARRQLENLDIRAPAAGKLTALNAEVGQSLGPGQRLGQIDDPTEFRLVAEIDEFYLSRVAVAQTAEFQAQRATYRLRIARIDSQVKSGQFNVDLAFEGQAPSGIQRGQTLPLRLYLGTASQAVLVPNGAFYRDTGGTWIFVLSPDGGRAIRRQVSLGRRNARHIEVIGGVEPGDRVITSSYADFVDINQLDLR